MSSTINRGELRCSGKVDRSCSTSGTRRGNLVTNSVISHWIELLSKFCIQFCYSLFYFEIVVITYIPYLNPFIHKLYKGGQIFVVYIYNIDRAGSTKYEIQPNNFWCTCLCVCSFFAYIYVWYCSTNTI